MKIISWNTAKRLQKVKQQTVFLQENDSDIITLQEILPSTEAEFQKFLQPDYPHIVSSFELARDRSLLVEKRMFGQLVASKYELNPLNPELFNVPWPERVLSVSIKIGNHKQEIHTTHIPPGSSNGWTKIEMIKGIVENFRNEKNALQILCGDFNTPQADDIENGLVTFGQKIKANGRAIVRDKFRGGLGKDWDAVERSLFTELNYFGLEDVFRKLNPGDFGAHSWQYVRKEKTFRKRFDHIFADKKLNILECRFLNGQGNLSDHSPILAEFV